MTEDTIMRSIFVLLLALALPGIVYADSDLVRKSSAHGVQETMDRLEALVKEKGLTVFARIDHKANAATVGEDMADSQLLIFGNPKAGTKIMLHDPAAGLDLPLRVLVYTDSDGNVQVIYHNPQGMKASYDLAECKVLNKVEGALDGLTGKVVQ